MSDAPEAATPCGSVRVWDDGRSTICIRPAGHLGYHTTRDRERPKWDDMEWWDRPLPLATPGGHDVSTHPATTGDNAMSDYEGQLTIVTCWRIDCAECGTDFYDARDAVPHYDTRQQAIQEEVFPCRAPDDVAHCGHGLEPQPDGKLLCQDCSHRAYCKRLGHTWGEWEHNEYDPKMAGSLPTHKIRYCGVCDDIEYDRPVGELLRATR